MSNFKDDNLDMLFFMLEKTFLLINDDNFEKIKKDLELSI